MKYVFAILVIIGSVFLGVVAQAKLQLAQEQNQQELTCVANMVNSGVERINIARGNGSCWFQHNGYYQ